MMEHFSTTYNEARARFREAAVAKNAILLTYPLNNNDELSIDVAIVGPSHAPTLVTSSGVHGVEGIFFGGYERSQSAAIIDQHYDAWFADAHDIVHIDLHTGLGAFGEYVLLLTEPSNSPNYSWYETVFGKETVEATDAKKSTSYTVRGLFGEWMKQRFAHKQYRFLTAEFGTYPILRIFKSLRAENQVHHYGSPSSTLYQRVKSELLECFYPSSEQWRKQTLQAGLNVIHQAVRHLEQNCLQVSDEKRLATT